MYIIYSDRTHLFIFMNYDPMKALMLCREQYMNAKALYLCCVTLHATKHD